LIYRQRYASPQIAAAMPVAIQKIDLIRQPVWPRYHEGINYQIFLDDPEWPNPESAVTRGSLRVGAQNPRRRPLLLTSRTPNWT